MKTERHYKRIADCVTNLPKGAIDSFLSGTKRCKKSPLSWEKTGILSRVPVLTAKGLVSSFLDVWCNQAQSMDGIDDGNVISICCGGI